MKAIDLTGQKFGKLTVIKRAENSNDKRKKTRWVCSCECGSIVIRTTEALKDSFVSSCENCRFVDNSMIGRTFYDLTVVKFAGKEHGQCVWQCVCNCGSYVYLNTSRLKSGNVKSCGCRLSKVTTERNTKHGLSKTRIYDIWSGMKKRCNDKNNSRYDDYGGRGIKIYEEWEHDFLSFYEWAMANGYSDELSIERIDVNGNYCPENCKWIPINQQSRNTRKTIRYTLFGVEKPLFEWAEMANEGNKKIYQRYKNGTKLFSDEELKQIQEKLRGDSDGM